MAALPVAMAMSGLSRDFFAGNEIMDKIYQQSGPLSPALSTSSKNSKCATCFTVVGDAVSFQQETPVQEPWKRKPAVGCTEGNIKPGPSSANSPLKTPTADTSGTDANLMQKLLDCLDVIQGIEDKFYSRTNSEAIYHENRNVLDFESNVKQSWGFQPAVISPEELANLTEYRNSNVDRMNAGLDSDPLGSPPEDLAHGVLSVLSPESNK